MIRDEANSDDDYVECPFCSGQDVRLVKGAQPDDVQMAEYHCGECGEYFVDYYYERYA